MELKWEKVLMLSLCMYNIIFFSGHVFKRYLFKTKTFTTCLFFCFL